MGYIELVLNIWRPIIHGKAQLRGTVIHVNHHMGYYERSPLNRALNFGSRLTVKKSCKFREHVNPSLSECFRRL